MERGIAHIEIRKNICKWYAQNYGPLIQHSHYQSFPICFHFSLVEGHGLSCFKISMNHHKLIFLLVSDLCLIALNKYLPYILDYKLFLDYRLL